MDLSRFAESQRDCLIDIAGVDPRSGKDYAHKAFFPPPLPESLLLSSDTWTQVAATTHVLGRLSNAGSQVPNPSLLQAPSIRREAQSTSALEGTFAPFEAVMEAEVSPEGVTASPEMREIYNYVRVAEEALEWVAEREITVGLLCELQRRLVVGTPSVSADDGRVRTRQVVIGPEGCSVADARYVPPPPGQPLQAAFADWQTWLAAEHALPPVVTAALAHYQFEALHPFADGNGRLGRLVIVLHLIRKGVLKNGLLSVSPWFEARRSEYQDHLLHVSQSGELDDWVRFFCTGVGARAEATLLQVSSLLDYQAELRNLGRQRKWRGTIQHVLEDLVGQPVLSARSLATNYEVTAQAAYNMIEKLLEAGVVEELTGRPYDRVFMARRVVEISRA